MISISLYFYHYHIELLAFSCQSKIHLQYGGTKINQEGVVRMR